MKRSERVGHAVAVYQKLALLDANLSNHASTPPESQSRQDLMVARTRMAALEHQISLLRLIQSEDRLRQQVFIALPSLLGGAALALLLQYLKL